MPASRIVLYERQGCHLCEEVRAWLDAKLGTDGYDRVDIDTDDALVIRYGFRVPVIAHAGRDQLEAPMTSSDVEALLARIGFGSQPATT